MRTYETDSVVDAHPSPSITTDSPSLYIGMILSAIGWFWQHCKAPVRYQSRVMHSSTLRKCAYKKQKRENLLITYLCSHSLPIESSLLTEIQCEKLTYHPRNFSSIESFIQEEPNRNVKYSSTGSGWQSSKSSSPFPKITIPNAAARGAHCPTYKSLARSKINLETGSPFCPCRSSRCLPLLENTQEHVSSCLVVSVGVERQHTRVKAPRGNACFAKFRHRSCRCIYAYS